MESETPLVQQEYGALLRWLDGTMVNVRESYVEDSLQPIRNLFTALGMFYPLIAKFIEYRKNKGKKLTSDTVYLMYSINVEMKEEFKKKPQVVTTSDSYKEFVKRWEARTEKINKTTNNDEFLESFLQTFFGLYRSRDSIDFDVKTLENFTLLCTEISQLNDLVLDQLYQTYTNPKYNEWYQKRYIGGRKLSRRRKSNSKSKLKYNKRRRSYKKSSHKRQRH